MPETAIKPWVQHEIEQAIQRRMNDQENGQSFPILYVYAGSRHASIKPPHEIANWVAKEFVHKNPDAADEILEDICQNLPGLKEKKSKPSLPNTQTTPSTDKPKQSFRYHLTLQAP